MDCGVDLLYVLCKRLQASSSSKDFMLLSDAFRKRVFRRPSRRQVLAQGTTEALYRAWDQAYPQRDEWDERLGWISGNLFVIYVCGFDSDKRAFMVVGPDKVEGCEIFVVFDRNGDTFDEYRAISTQVLSGGQKNVEAAARVFLEMQNGQYPRSIERPWKWVYSNSFYCYEESASRNARLAVCALIAVRQFRFSVLSDLPFEVVKLIADKVWESRKDKDWW